MKKLHVIEQECQKIEFRPQSNVSSDGFDDAILIKKTTCDTPGCVAGTSKSETESENYVSIDFTVRVSMVFCDLEYTCTWKKRIISK